MKYLSLLLLSTSALASTIIQPIKFSHDKDEIKIVSKFESRETVYRCLKLKGDGVCTLESNAGNQKMVHVSTKNFDYLFEKAVKISKPSKVAAAAPKSCPQRFSLTMAQNGPTQNFWVECLDSKSSTNAELASLRELIADLFR